MINYASYRGDVGGHPFTHYHMEITSEQPTVLRFAHLFTCCSVSAVFSFHAAMPNAVTAPPMSISYQWLVVQRVVEGASIPQNYRVDSAVFILDTQTQRNIFQVAEG